MPPLLHGQAEAGRHRRPGGALPAPLRRAQAGGQVTALDRPTLLQAKLAALVKGRWGEAPEERHTFPDGAAIIRRRLAWVYSETPARLVGGAMAWAASRGADELHLVVDDPEGAGDVARRAAGFVHPPAVWVVDGRALTPAGPAPLAAAAPPPPAALALVPVIESVGAEAVAEHGTVKAEVKGLEVARVETLDGARLAVGVGRHDREARRIVHAGEPADPAAELAGAVRTVAAHRRAGAAAHPANQLAAERWLRWVLVRHPNLVGARSLAPFPPPGPALDLTARAPAPAVGSTPEGRDVVVVASVGVDLELVPAAVDALNAAGDPEALLVVAVPEGDDHRVTRRLVAALAAPAEVRTVPGDWRALD